MSDFTNRINGLLKRQNKSKRSFCKGVGVLIQSLYDWEKRGTIPNAETVLHIAQYLNTTVEYLLTGQESNEHNAKQELNEYKIKYDTLLNQIQGLENAIQAILGNK